MNWASCLLGVVRRYDDFILLGLAALVLILLLSVVGLRVKVGRLSRRKPVVEISGNNDLLETLSSGLAEAQETSKRLSSLLEESRASLLRFLMGTTTVCCCAACSGGRNPGLLPKP
jgi:hypothetical protein